MRRSSSYCVQANESHELIVIVNSELIGFLIVKEKIHGESFPYFYNIILYLVIYLSSCADRWFCIYLVFKFGSACGQWLDWTLCVDFWEEATPKLQRCV